MLIIKKVTPKDTPPNFYRRQYLCKIECDVKNIVNSSENCNENCKENYNENCNENCNENEIAIRPSRYLYEANNNYDTDNVASIWHNKYNNVVELDSDVNTSDDFYIDNG